MYIILIKKGSQQIPFILTYVKYDSSKIQKARIDNSVTMFQNVQRLLFRDGARYGSK